MSTIRDFIRFVRSCDFKSKGRCSSCRFNLVFDRGCLNSHRGCLNSHIGHILLKLKVISLDETK